MEKLRTHLNALTVVEQADFADRCGTTIGFLRKVLSTRQPISAVTSINIERESDGAVRCEDLRPDVDWAYLRSSRRRPGGRRSA